MFKFLIGVLIVVFCVQSQINIKTVQEDLSSFRADSTWRGEWRSLTDGENANVTLLLNDTSTSGYASDSIAAKIAVEYGSYYNNYYGLSTIVAIGPPVFVDSVRTSSGRFTTNTTWRGYDSFPETMLDTNANIGYAFNVRYLQPYVNAMWRPIVTGLTGNKKSSFLRARVVTTQRKYSLAGKN